MQSRVISPLIRVGLILLLLAVHHRVVVHAQVPLGGGGNNNPGISIFRPRPPIRPPPIFPADDCQCNDFVWTRSNGVRAGNCLSTDVDGNAFCYLNQPNREVQLQPLGNAFRWK